MNLPRLRAQYKKRVLAVASPGTGLVRSSAGLWQSLLKNREDAVEHIHLDGSFRISEPYGVRAHLIEPSCADEVIE